MVLSYLCIFLMAMGTVHGACSFPTALSGTFRSSRWDDLEFYTDKVTVPDLADLGTNTNFSCDTKEGNYYLIRSDNTVNILSNNVEVVACLYLDTVNSDPGIKYIYYHGTVELSLPSGETQPVRLVTPGTSITTSDTCTVSTPYSTGTYDIMIATSSVAAAIITCPNPFLANYNNYTITKSGGSTACDGTGYIYVCDDSQTVNIDYSVCSEVTFYSSLGNLSCVYFTPNADYTTFHVNLLNHDSSVDNSATYFYTCVVIDYGSTPVYATQYPRKCDASQTSTSVPSAGYEFEMYANVTCLPTSGSFDITPIVAGVCAFVFVIIVILVVKLTWKKLTARCKKGHKGTSTKVTPAKKSKKEDDSSDEEKAEPKLRPTGLLSPLPTPTTQSSRTLETSQSTRTAVTISQMDIVEDPTPRRLTPLVAVIPDNPYESERTPRPKKLPPLTDPSKGPNSARSSGKKSKNSGRKTPRGAKNRKTKDPELDSMYNNNQGSHTGIPFDDSSEEDRLSLNLDEESDADVGVASEDSERDGRKSVFPGRYSGDEGSADIDPSDMVVKQTTNRFLEDDSRVFQVKPQTAAMQAPTFHGEVHNGGIHSSLGNYSWDAGSSEITPDMMNDDNDGLSEYLGAIK